MSTASAPKQSPPGGEDFLREGSFPSRWLRFGTFELDLQREQLSKDGAHVKVQGKVYQALVALLENPGEIVTREALRTHLWPMDTHVNYDANVNTTVNKLRLVLGDRNDQPMFVETIPRKGYSFIAKVEYVDEAGVKSVPTRTEAPEGKAPIWRTVRAATLLGTDPGSLWFKAGVIALVIASMLFGAAITLFSHRPF